MQDFYRIIVIGSVDVAKMTTLPLKHLMGSAVFRFYNTFVELPECFYEKVLPEPLLNPSLVSMNKSLLEELNISDCEKNRDELTKITAGLNLPEEANPIATVYSGHQFGTYVPQLGDGRALLLGEVLINNQRRDVQLKGSGATPFSRQADGRAVLRSSIREYLASEALYRLGIPTTRALCLVDSETPVYREVTERGAAIIRVAESHIRFGHFEFFYYTKQHDALKKLADYTIERHYPHLVNMSDKYLQFYAEVLQRTAALVARWQAVGFCHGVMNTDNMSIAGITLDYGPYAFMDTCDPDFICNHSDWQGRYAYKQQPGVAYWNCGRLGQALLPLFDGKTEFVQKTVDQFPQWYLDAYTYECRKKMGLNLHEKSDQALFDNLLVLLKENKVDYTRFFRTLCDFSFEGNNQGLYDFFEDSERLNVWLSTYTERLHREASNCNERKEAMKNVNPKYVIRNYMLQTAIEGAEKHDYSHVDTLLELVSHPYDEQPHYQHFSDEPPAWSRSVTVSCSS